MSQWQFGDSLNWDLVLRNSYYAKPLGGDSKKFLPIPTITVAVDRYTLLIGARNSQASPNWFLAGYVSNRLLFSPSSTSQFMAVVQSCPSVRLRLNQLTLVRFPDFNLIPYLLEINVARWHKEMFLEVWKYSGQVNDIEASLARIETKLDKP